MIQPELSKRFAAVPPHLSLGQAALRRAGIGYVEVVAGDEGRSLTGG